MFLPDTLLCYGLCLCIDSLTPLVLNRERYVKLVSNKNFAIFDDFFERQVQSYVSVLQTRVCKMRKYRRFGKVPVILARQSEKRRAVIRKLR